MQERTVEALNKAYAALTDTAFDLYAEVDLAIDAGNYNEASLMESQAEKIFQLAENLEVLLSEQGE